MDMKLPTVGNRRDARVPSGFALTRRWLIALAAFWLLLFSSAPEPEDGSSRVRRILCNLPASYSMHFISSLHCEGENTPPVHTTGRQSTGLTDLVQWDEYSLFIKDQRVFLWYASRSSHKGNNFHASRTGRVNSTHGDCPCHRSGQIY